MEPRKRSYWRPAETEGRGMPLLIVACTAAIILVLVYLFQPALITQVLALLSPSH